MSFDVYIPAIVALIKWLRVLDIVLLNLALVLIGYWVGDALRKALFGE